MRLAVLEVEAMMARHPQGTTLEEALGVFEVFASGSLTDEIYGRRSSGSRARPGDYSRGAPGGLPFVASLSCR